MNRSMHRRRAVLGALGAITLAVTLAACGEQEAADTPGTGATQSTAADPALVAKVPDAVKADGVIKVGSDATYPPAEYLDTDGKTVVGFDIELFNAVAAKLGLTAEYVPAPFDNIIPGIGSGAYEVGVSSFTVNEDRKKQANMVSYYQVGTQWIVPTGNPGGVASPDAACGKRIAVQTATVQVEDLQARSKKCTDAGQPAITVNQYQDQTEATAAVVTKKDDATLADYPVGVYAIQQSNGQLELLGEMYDAAPYGYVIAKDQTAFADVVKEAVQALIDDGTYQAILDKWEVGSGAITTSVVNP